LIDYRLKIGRKTIPKSNLLLIYAGSDAYVKGDKLLSNLRNVIELFPTWI